MIAQDFDQVRIAPRLGRLHCGVAEFYIGAWKRFEEAIPGSVHLVPPQELSDAIEADYVAMRDMILGDVPHFGWIMEQLQHAEAATNGP